MSFTDSFHQNYVLVDVNFTYYGITSRWNTYKHKFDKLQWILDNAYEKCNKLESFLALFRDNNPIKS